MASRASRVTRRDASTPTSSPTPSSASAAGSSSSTPSRRTTRGSDASSSPSGRRRTSRSSSGRTAQRQDEADDHVVFEADLPDDFDHRRVKFIMKGWSEYPDDDDDDEYEEEDSDDATATAPAASTNTSSAAASTARSPSPTVINGNQSHSSAASPSPSPTRDLDGDLSDSQKPRSIASIMEEVPLAPIPRKPVEIPALPAPRARVMKEDLKPFRRPALRMHERTEEMRIVKVQSLINEKQYPEQLIDANMTMVQYATPSAHAVSAGGLMSPLMSSRSPLVLGSAGTTALLPSGGSIFQPTYSRQSSIGSSPMIGRRQPTNIPPPVHAVLPSSPVVSGSRSAYSAMPSTPHASFQRQPSALTFPMPAPTPIGPKSSIVTQMIPFGRIQIKPSTRSILCASSVPLTPNSTIHPSWYLPTSRPSTVYITLELPGYYDYEIKLENVFLLPDAIDTERLRVQQRRIFEGKLDCRTITNDVKTQAEEADSKDAILPSSGVSLFKSPSPSEAPAAPASSRRVGGHLHRKRQRPTSSQHLSEMSQSTMDEVGPEPTDLLERELRRADDTTPFGPPQLRDVQVSIKSAGKFLLPVPAHTVQEPIYATGVSAPKRPVKQQTTVTAAGVQATSAAAKSPSTSTTTAAAASTAFCYAPPAVVGTTPRFVPQGPSTLSASRPSLTFAHGTVTLERLKPRVGGWVVKRGLTMEAARQYRPITDAVKKEENGDMVIDEPTEPTVKSEPGVKSEPIVKSEPVVKSESAATSHEHRGARDSDSGPDDSEDGVSWQRACAGAYTSTDCIEHDIAEVGDVIRIVLNTPTPPPVQPRWKVTPPMTYEIVLEGIRVAPVSAAPMFPEMIDTYRLGTAPKSVVEADALSTRLTSSVLPSSRLIGAGQRHWSEMGRAPLKREPILFPDTFLPSSDDSDSASDDDSDCPPPSAVVREAAERRKYFADFPQNNFDEYFTPLHTDRTDVDEENACLERSDDSDDEEELEEYTTTSDSEDAMPDSEEEESGDDDEIGTPRKDGSNGGAKKLKYARSGAPVAGARLPPTPVQAKTTKKSMMRASVPPVPAHKAKMQMSTHSSSPSSGSGGSRTGSSLGVTSSGASRVLDPVWVACDSCGKWRKMPLSVDSDSLPSVWYCEMNPDTTHNSCKHTEEQEQDVTSVAMESTANNNAAKPKPKSIAVTGTPEKPAAAPVAEKPLSASAQAAQAQHLAMLFPSPRLPTSEDVCAKCESALASPDEEAASEKNTIFCHGPCARTWHRACATLTAAGKAHTPSAATAAASPLPAASGSAHSNSSSALTPHPSTHVMPFTPLTTSYWYCSECMSLTNCCFVCYKPGTIDPTQQRIFDEKSKRWNENPALLRQCPFAGGCGRFYHSKCLFELPRTKTHKGSRLTAGRDAAPPTPNLVPRPRAPLICALHTCCSCGGAGTTSTSVRDVGRTLVHCIRCSEASHWSSKCRSDNFVTTTKKYGICDGHESGSGSDAEEEDVRERRLASCRGLTLTFDKAPTHLFGSEPTVEPDSEEEDDEDEEEEEEWSADDDEEMAEAKSTPSKHKMTDEAEEPAKRQKI